MQVRLDTARYWSCVGVGELRHHSRGGARCRHSFDQWGVELGKKLALEIAPAVQGDAEALHKQDSSTQQLVRYYREHRR